MFTIKYKEISGYLLIAYFGRIIFMLWDLYARHIFILPNSGSDAKGFYKSAIYISHNIHMLGGEIYGGIYAKILGVVFYFIGDNRIIGQYINVVLGMAVIILIYRILKMLNVEKENLNGAILIASILPNTLIFSAILLRENFITFFVTLSFYFFIKWYKKGKSRNQIFSIISIIVASVFHSGVIGMLVGYILAYVLFNRKKYEYKLSGRSIMVIMLFIFIALTVMNNQNIFLGKFSNIEEIDDIINAANSRGGESKYLTSLQISTWWQILLYSPVYMMYFLISPLPWDWRGFNDILTFCIDSVLYLYLLYIGIKNIGNIKTMRNNKYIIFNIGISILITVFIFGIGVSNAGTAMRHRQKILPVLIILSTVIKDSVDMGNCKNRCDK